MIPIWLDEHLMCRRAGCSICASAPEFMLVHYDCYQIFRECSRQAFRLEEHEFLDWLWTVSSWRNPWPRSLPIKLREEDMDQSALVRMAEAAGLPQLCKLPPEVVRIIRDFSRHALLWRSISVVALVSKKPQLQPFLRVPLDGVPSWKREESFWLTSYPLPKPSHVRLTIDFHGISKVERLHERPLYDGDISMRLAFIVECASDTTDIYAEFKVCIFSVSTSCV